MKTKRDQTAVIFRTFKKEDGRIVALFPFEPATTNGFMCNSYMSVGQHGGATPNLVAYTRPATRSEIAPLRKELTRIGYRLRELKRFPSNAYQVRKERASK